MLAEQAMSEFKYACPVCGQHIGCDSSQAGTVMECPTCFQKITVPQAPASEDSKFIITGTKVGERPAPNIPEYRAVEPERSSPVMLIMTLLILACVVGAVASVYVFRGQIFKSSAPVEPTNEVASSTPTETYTQPATNQARPKPQRVAPPANDTNWMMDLRDVMIPDSVAAGRIHGTDFICERAVIENGALILRLGRSGPITLALSINFGVTQGEALANKNINVTTNVPKAAVVTLRYVDADQRMVRENYTNGYALRIKFNSQNGNRISGNIYFCAPDDSKSYVMGTFRADIRRPRP